MKFLLGIDTYLCDRPGPAFRPEGVNLPGTWIPQLLEQDASLVDQSSLDHLIGGDPNAVQCDLLGYSRDGRDIGVGIIPSTGASVGKGVMVARFPFFLHRCSTPGGPK